MTASVGHCSFATAQAIYHELRVLKLLVRKNNLDKMVKDRRAATTHYRATSTVIEFWVGSFSEAIPNCRVNAINLDSKLSHPHEYSEWSVTSAMA